MENIFKLSKLKLIFVLALIVLFGLCGLSFTVNTAQKTVYALTEGDWTDEVNLLSYSLSGTGAEDDPYILSDAKDLAYLSKQSALNALDLCYSYYILDNDIDLSGHYFTPIGSQNEISKIYNIVLDGQGHSITGLEIDNLASYNGLFGYIAFSAVSDLILDVNIKTSGEFTGGLAGFAESCTFKNITVNGGITVYNNSAGGLIGSIDGYDTVFNNCVNNAAVTAENGSYTGGIFGSAYSGSAELNACTNNAVIKGNEYVAGIGSGISTTSATFMLIGCANTNNIVSLSYQEKYFAGLIAFASMSQNNTMRLCFNTGNVSAANSYYVAGLNGFGKFTINDSFNNAKITGDTLVAGLAACGAYEVTGSYNGAGGIISATSLSNDAVAAGLVGRMIGLGSVTLSHNKGNVSVANDGACAGILGEFNAAGGAANPVVISDCYNWGAAEDAFLSASSRTVNVENCYNRYTNASVAAKPNIVHSLIFGNSVNLYNNISAHNPAAWKIDAANSYYDSLTDTYINYNDGMPYIRCGLISELTIDTMGASALSTFKSFYLQDLNSATKLLFTDFKKLGYTFTGLSFVPYAAGIDINPADPQFVHKKQIETLYAQYALVDYKTEVGVEAGSAGEGTAVLADGVMETDTGYINLATTKSLRADKLLPTSNEFSYWAVEFGGTLYQISDQIECPLSSILTAAFLANFESYLTGLSPTDTAFYFYAVFEDSWDITIDYLSNDTSRGELEIIVGGVSHSFNFENADAKFRVPVEKDAFDQPVFTQIYFSLTASQYYYIYGFSISAVNDPAGQTKLDGYTFYEYITNCLRGVKLQSDLRVSIMLEPVDNYIFNVTAVLEDDSLITDEELIEYGNGSSFSIGLTVDGNSIIAKTEGIDRYRFIGFKIKYEGSSSYEWYPSANGALNSFKVSPGFLADFFDSGQVYIVAVYKQRYQFNVLFNGTTLNETEYGYLTVLGINTQGGYNGKYFDEASNISIIIGVKEHCKISYVSLPHTNNTINVELSGDLTITINLEKIKYYINLYTVDYDNRQNNEITGNLVVINPTSDGYGDYLEYDDNYVIYNLPTVQTLNMQFVGWYYINPNTGGLIPLPAGFIDEDGNLRAVFYKDVINSIRWQDAAERFNITIVAKIIDIYVLDINLSEIQKLRGDYKLEIYASSAGGYVPADEGENEFAVGTSVRLTALPFKYFSFAGFEDIYGNRIPGDALNPYVYTFTLNRSQVVSVYFDPDPYDIIFSKGSVSPNGKLDYIISTGQANTVRIGDSIIISYQPDSNFQVSGFTINGKTFTELQEEFGAQIMANSIVIKVSKEFIDWAKTGADKLTFDVSTTVTTMFMILLILLAVLVPGLVLAIVLIALANERRKHAALRTKDRHTKNKAGIEFVSRLDLIHNVIDEKEGE